ncbi:hypothetical protein PLICRDRAFT_56335 [Plicaturopsis crispa FD-325 SS-3]|nr:hypothetical protein PLICRDRAFT_56335 [Plicaturopsis crispa FD-325 SS-3]
MDRPLGPRRPDRGNEAYEAIFGRPSASHHQLAGPPGPPVPHYNQHAPPNGQQHHYQQHQQYQAHVDRRTSYASSLAPSYRQPANAAYRQSYYPTHSPQPSQPPLPPPPGTYSPYPPNVQSLAPQSTLVAPSVHSRARSVISSPRSAGIIAPQPEEPPDAGLEALTRAGMTPAQAYQAQVYLNSPAGQQAEWSNRSRPVDAPQASSPSRAQYQAIPQHADIPRLGVNLEHDDGRLGLDFGGSSPSDQGTDDGSSSSELPWARSRPPAPKGPQPRAPSQRFSGSSEPPPAFSSRPYPLQLETAVESNPRSSVTSTSPASSMHVDPSVTARRSSESSRTMPGGPTARRDRTAQDRSMSMSAASPAMKTILDSSRSTRPPIPSLLDSSSSRTPGGSRRTPIVYPALLSRVALAFRERVPITDRVKDGLTYKDAFDGREAVDKIAYIIKTTDRNLALLLGRALDAQKFFHDVTYDHRLRDSAGELYQFRTKLPSPFVSGDLANGEEGVKTDGTVTGKDVRPGLPKMLSASLFSQGSSAPSGDVSTESHADSKEDSQPASPSPTEPAVTHQRDDSAATDDVPIPSGVFTLLTDCYSPTCSREQLCYSIACPRRLEQQARLNMKPQPGLKKQISRESLGDFVEPGTLWIHSVPKEIVENMTDAEKRRQEAINEVIYTERDFVRDMEYLRDVWIKGLKGSGIIPPEREEEFIVQVFWNIHDIIAVNTRLRDALNKRQKQYAVVETIGDILLDAVPHFSPFVQYGAHQLYGKYEFEKEKSSNTAFAQFVETTERLPESRKLELNGYLTKPTTRLARYPLLLGAVLKHTPDDSPDKTTLPEVIAKVKEFLGEVNVETGRAENRFNLLQLDQQLTFKPGEQVDLRLQEEGRELIYKGALNRRGGSGQGDSGDLQVYLFDHALLMVKQKSKHEQLKVYRRPIPLELLLISAIDDYANQKPSYRQKSALVKKSSFTKSAPYAPAVPIRVEGGNKGGFAITFVHLGRKHYQITLWASTYVSQRKWVENITKQQDAMRERSMIFDTSTLSEGFFVGPIQKVNCAAPFHAGRRVVYGTDDGVYLSDLREANRAPVKVLALLDVSQVDFLEEYQLLIVLSERQVITFPFDALDPMDPMSGLKRAKRISSHTSFFKAGMCLGKTLVCIVKSSPLSSTIKALEPIDQNIRGRSKPTFRKLLQGGNDTLKLFREFYIPVESSSIHFLKTKLCVGCSKGFEIVDLESLDTQGLLDPADDSLDFVRKRENLRPMAIYRIDNEFLLCYDDFAFYVNKSGWRSRKDFMVHWEGSPTGFALHYPYVLAFESTFVEIRHVETGFMSQVIQGNNLRLLFADTPPSTTNTAAAYYNPYQGVPAPAYNPYGAPNSFGSRQSLYNGGYGAPVHPQMPYPPQYPRPSHNHGRDEILLVSDDRVLSLHLAAGQPQHVMPDNASMVSIPR